MSVNTFSPNSPTLVCVGACNSLKVIDRVLVGGRGSAMEVGESTSHRQQKIES